MGADYYETSDECALVPGCLPMGVGNNTVIKRAIIDKNARIGPDCVIVNAENVQVCDVERLNLGDGNIVEAFCVTFKRAT